MSVKAYSYARFSSKAQAEGDSLRRQLKAAFDWADKHGLQLDTRHRDLGVSAYTGAHRVKGALASFIRSVEDGEITRGSYLLVDSMDRLSRESETEVLHLLLTLTRNGIKVVNLAENHVLDEKAEFTDYIRVLIHASRSNAESVEKGRKVGLKRAENKRLAREEGKVWSASGPGWLEAIVTGTKPNRHIEWKVIKERKQVVQMMFDFAEAGLGTVAITQRLNDEGYKSFRYDRPWQQTVVLDMLRNRAVIGEYQPKFATSGSNSYNRPNDGDPISGYYPEIIKPEQFHRVQAIIGARKPKQGRSAGSKVFNNLFIGLGSCHECGGTVGIHVVKAKAEGRAEYQALRCINSARNAIGSTNVNNVCTNRTRYSYRKLEASILAHVGSYKIPNSKSGRNRESDLADAIAMRDDLAKKVENLLDLVEDGNRGMVARYNERVTQLEAQEAEVAKLKIAVEQTTYQVPLDTRRKALAGLIERLNTVEGAALYQLRASVALALKGVVDQIRFHKDGNVDVIQAGGGRAYRFKDGDFIATANLLPDLEIEADDIGVRLRAGLTSHDPEGEERLKRVIAAE
uniref:Recombinase n=1 Tax=Caulobacter sp. (strain K31) TaxID=366602 RepID=B0T614_CAUSK